MLKVNDKELNFTGSIKELLDYLKLNQSSCAVLVNGEIIKRKDWEKYLLKNDDYVEIVSFVGGG
ncbi:thiamine biosynthesis protein ThiS [Carboxydothermus islandicus]|uniref:Thiamine biosynthesis protein ThiS n=1 Tax=Carboxydothermus islandicus TaxID=661089 RepID=A0A1L8D477_9THEO|nr:sulfur carrier protein ThiS [Carboxydothermus islandicus]GAV25972.1 thiamine biosynthesis protein ThiS [Carboxydothermus islandicus]